MAKGKYTKETCLELLCQKAAQLAAAGESRLPKRSDFAQDEVVAIKAFLGPWPRALEAAGLKAPPPVDRLARNRQKRIRAKRRRRELLCAASQKDSPPCDANDALQCGEPDRTGCCAADNPEK